MARWPTGLRRWSPTGATPRARSRSLANCPRRGLPRGGGRPDGRLRRRQRHYQALSQNACAAAGGPGASVEAAVAAANRATLAALAPGQQAPLTRPIRRRWPRCPMARRRRPGSRWGSRPPRRSWRCVPAMALTRLKAIGRKQPQGSMCPPSCARHRALARSQALAAGRQMVPPGPPPSLTSAVWARDYNEIKALGAKQVRSGPPTKRRSPASGKRGSRPSTCRWCCPSPRPRTRAHPERPPARSCHPGDG